jgi:hypothetical protein
VLIFINLKSISSQRWFSQFGYQKFNYFFEKRLFLFLKTIIKKEEELNKKREKKESQVL